MRERCHHLLGKPDQLFSHIDARYIVDSAGRVTLFPGSTFLHKTGAWVFSVSHFPALTTPPPAFQISIHSQRSTGDEVKGRGQRNAKLSGALWFGARDPTKMAANYRKIPKISPRAFIFQGSFWGAYFWRGLSKEGNLSFKIDWASLTVARKFTVFPLFYFVFEGNFWVQDQGGWGGWLYLEGRLYMEGRLFSEFYGSISKSLEKILHKQVFSIP